MKFIAIALLMFSFSFLINCRSQRPKKIYPDDKFSVLQAKRSDGKPIIGSVNMAYKDYSDRSRYPWCLTINVALDLKNVDANGLPNKFESDTANNFEDELLKKIKEISTAHYIGHFYNDSFLDIYIYLDKPEKVGQFLQTQVDKPDLIRSFRFEIKKDPDWETVKGFMK